MKFSNKLNFLMNITNTSNKELAEGISVDRSLVSLLRTGKRKTPRNHDHILHMASFFARRCLADFQFYALAEMLEKPELRSGIPEQELSEQLYKWMLGDTPIVEHIFENISQPPSASYVTQGFSSTSLLPTHNRETSFFTGVRDSANHCAIYFVLFSRLTIPAQSIWYQISIWNGCLKIIIL